MYLPPSAGCQIPESLALHSYSRRAPTSRKRIVAPPPLDLGSIEEERSEYDSGILDLGAETPGSQTPSLVENNAFISQWAQAGIAVPRVPARRPSLRLGKDRERAQRKETLDRDCGICFEFAVVPCRTLCCGKIFCTEHLADWLHGPNAEGRCPNCENLCSLEDSTLSLAPPSLLDGPSLSNRRTLAPTASATKQQLKLKPGVYPSSPLTAVQLHQNDTLPMPPTRQVTAAHSHAPGSSSSSSATTSPSLEGDEDLKPDPHGLPMQLGVVSSSALSTTPFASNWGAVSRLMSIVTFLMFLYKLLS